jgi:isopentenyl phosphate kinase
MIVIKLGGSVITKKSKYRSFNESVVVNIVKTLKGINDNMIIVHGGGSFGHIKAKEYGLPGFASEQTMKGMNIVHNDMANLNLKISKILYSSGIYNIPLPVSSLVYDNKKNYAVFGKYLNMGITPVSYGDTYIHRNKIGIYSGDNIAYDVARRFHPSAVVFFSDVDGIYDKNPKTNPDAKLLKTISDEFQHDDITPDVTGGIMNKYRKMRDISDLGIPVYLINGLYPERIYNIGKNNFTGTVI